MADTTTVAGMKITADEAKAMELESWGPITKTLAGPMETRGRRIWESPDKRVSAGVWECDAGRFRAHFATNGEVIHVISGRMTCISDDGTTTTLEPGDTMVIPAGWNGEWHVEEPLRKIYTGFSNS